MRFLVDMPLSPGLVRWLAGKGHDAVHAAEIGLAQASDTEIIQRAKCESRVVITADLDYPRLLAILSATAPATILYRGGDFSESEMIGRLEAVLRAVPEPDILDSLIVVDRFRLRRRRLPLR